MAASLAIVYSESVASLTGTAKILLIDDDPLVRQLFASLLRIPDIP